MVKRSPLFYYTICYITGIYIGNNISCSPQTVLTLSITVITISFILFCLAYKKACYKFNLYLQYLLFLAFLLAGISNMALSPYAQKKLISSLAQKSEFKELKLSIRSESKIHNNSSSIECHSIEYNENVIIYSKSKTIFDTMSLGDIIILDYTPKEIVNINNDFDYKKFQAKKKCFTYGYLNDKNFRLIKSNRKSLFIKIRAHRKKIITKIRDRYDNREWCDILIALVSGEKAYLEDRTKEIYKASGAVHLMAVSGLHVGFVYLFVLNILSFLGNKGLFKYLKSLIIIVSIWLYCAFSGFSPSSIRASIMISILVISELYTGRYVSLNALCASALIITIVQPQSLFDIGFQLSYVALLSIIILNPFFNQQRFANSKIVQYCWNIITISISCQIGTSFITMGSFGYFPVFFMISNIILMPLTALVIYGFVAISIFGFSDTAVTLFSQIIKILIDIMYKTALRIESLPFSIIDLNVNKSTKTVAYIIAVILTASIAYGSRKAKLQSRSYE